MSTKKIVILCCYSIFPPTSGGSVHTAVIGRSLARLGYEVTLYSLAGRQPDYRSRQPYLRKRIEPGLVEEVHLGLGYGLAQAIAGRLGLPRRWQYELIRRGWVPKRLKQLLVEADVVLCDRTFCPRVPGPWAAKPWILISHNLEHRLLAIGNRGDRLHVGWMQKLEREAPAHYDDIMACAEDDQAYFRAHDASGRLKLPLVGSAVSPRDYVVPAGTRKRIRAELGVADGIRLITFSGSGFGPNLGALAVVKAFAAAEREWLLAKQLRFLILGSMEPAAYVEGALIVTGRVPEIAPYFAAADAGLNPITIGSGANVKLFEYLAARLPVISTRFGVRGTSLEAASDYIEFDSPDLKPALEQFIARDSTHWKAHAEAVWLRHQESCDIERVVANAIKVLPGF